MAQESVPAVNSLNIVLDFRPQGIRGTAFEILAVNDGSRTVVNDASR